MIKKSFVLLILFCTVLSLTGCFERIVPTDGAWYCKELDMELHFNNEEISKFRGIEEYQIGGEYQSNVIYLRNRPGPGTVFACDCIYNDGSKIIVIEHDTGKRYTFVRTD